MRKFTSVLLALVLCAALLCIGAAAAGSGDVIEIDTPEELAKIGVDEKYPLNGNYILTDDIDLGGEGNQWTPIGSGENRAFTGTFDGDEHTISGLYINNGDSVYAGLFGYVGRGGMIKGLTVEGKITISGSTSCVGGIAGRVDSYQTSEVGVLADSNDTETGIIDCTSNVTINVTYNGSSGLSVGGIVGSCGGATISGCKNCGDVSVVGTRGEYDIDVNIGGIVGYSGSSTIIRNCCNTGAVSVQDADYADLGGIIGESRTDRYVDSCYNTGAVSVRNTEDAALGGVVGYNYDDDDESTVSKCYNTGAVNAEDAEYANLGGVVGENDGSVSNCYNTGTVSGNENIGGVAGHIYNDTLSSCYYLEQDNLPGIGYGGHSDDDASPLTKEEFADTYSFTDWDFANTWTIADMGGFERPVLIDNKETVVTYTVTVNGSYAGETGEGSYLAGASVTASAGERVGYSFAGWTAEGVDLADASAENVTFTMPANDVTLTAEWDYIVTPGDPTYRPIIDEPENGGVTTSPSRPEAGDTVTVNPEPDEGYEVDEIIVTDKDGNPVEVTRNPDGSYSFTQPEGAVTIEVTFRPASGLPFTDVAEGDWFYDYVEYVYENSLMDGTSDTTFEPNANMTRAMVWAILARIDGETVTGANWVETAREWAMANGVSDGENANGYVTREQLATMLWRYAGEPASSYSLSAFTDADSVSGYAATAMAWAVEHGIITGVTDTTLVPQGTATRAQCAAMLMRFVENVK